MAAGIHRQKTVTSYSESLLNTNRSTTRSDAAQSLQLDKQKPNMVYLRIHIRLVEQLLSSSYIFQ